MQKLLILFACLLAVALGVELHYAAPGTLYAVPLPVATVYARQAPILPLAYTRVQATLPVPAVETYNSVQTPDSFHQQYRSDYKPLTYEIYN